jgi:hypothetical protein
MVFSNILIIVKVEYAMEAVKQGSATVGLKSSTHAVVVALKRASSELSGLCVLYLDHTLFPVLVPMHGTFAIISC